MAPTQVERSSRCSVRSVSENAAISGNETTGGVGGIVYDNQSLPCADPCVGPPAGLFIVRNTIVAHNGGGFDAPDECVILGRDQNTLQVVGSGNLIMRNSAGSGCPGVASADDPQLGGLQNNSGLTPTMAISSASPAWNAADPSTSLPTDQRGQTRPRMGGFDIGAFELCVNHLDDPCFVLGGAVDTELFGIGTSSAVGGTTVPAPGQYELERDLVIVLTALPSPNYCFVNWRGDTTIPAAPTTTVVLDRAQNVIANFARIVTSSIRTAVLAPPNHALVNVGLGATGHCGAASTFEVQVFSDEDDGAPTDHKGTAFFPDASNVAVNTLMLRAERAEGGDGRVYLIVVRTSDTAGNRGFSCSAVVVPHDSSAASLASVNNQATAARAYCEANGGPPPGYLRISG